MGGTGAILAGEEDDDVEYEVLAGKNVVLGVSGSIAAYKAVTVASALAQAGAEPGHGMRSCSTR